MLSRSLCTTEVYLMVKNFKKLLVRFLSYSIEFHCQPLMVLLTVVVDQCRVPVKKLSRE